MLAAIYGKISCVEKLIEAKANVRQILSFFLFHFDNFLFKTELMLILSVICQILMFDSLNGRTCLHYAAYYGHSDCLATILYAARTSHVAASWWVPLIFNRIQFMHQNLYFKTQKRYKSRLNFINRIGDFRGFSRFVNIRDGKGATPLHLAARQGRPQCVHLLLDSGALVCASTGRNGYEYIQI